jgi:hypothetical protein
LTRKSLLGDRSFLHLHRRAVRVPAWAKATQALQGREARGRTAQAPAAQAGVGQEEALGAAAEPEELVEAEVVEGAQADRKRV